MKRVIITGGRDHEEDRWVDELVGELVEGKWDIWKSFGPTPVALTSSQQAAVRYVFEHIADALHDAERNALTRTGFAVDNEWLNYSILRAINERRGIAFRRTEYKYLVGQATTAAQKINTLAFEIAELLSLMRIEDGDEDDLDNSIRSTASKLSYSGLKAADTMSDYAEELREFTATVETAYPAHRQKKIWRWSLTRAFAFEWHAAGHVVGDDTFRRVVAAAASAIEFISSSEDGKIPAGTPKFVDPEECPWISEALAFGDGAPWHSKKNS